MQTLFIPDIIHIAIRDKDGNALQQENILIGIHTSATHKNDVDISPFLSDKTGQITITKDQIKQRADNFISYGIMDYNSIEYAKPNIQIYFWGNNSLDRYIRYWSSNLNNNRNHTLIVRQVGSDKTHEIDFTELHKKQEQDLLIFSSCFNRTLKQRDDIILAEDSWDRPVSEKNYNVDLNL